MYCVYMMASRRNGTLYVGVTNDMARRAFEHRAHKGSVFTRRYGVTRLVWMEPYEDISAAIAREKQIKGWNRAWKLKLIEVANPDWLDLYELLQGASGAWLDPLPSPCGLAGGDASVPAAVLRRSYARPPATSFGCRIGAWRSPRQRMAMSREARPSAPPVTGAAPVRTASTKAVSSARSGSA